MGVIRCGNKRVDCWHSLRWHPVSQTGRQRVRETVAVLICPLWNPVIEILLHRGIRFFECSNVAVTLIAFPGNDEPERVPRGRRAAAVDWLECRFADVAEVFTARRYQRHLALL